MNVPGCTLESLCEDREGLCVPILSGLCFDDPNTGQRDVLEIQKSSLEKPGKFCLQQLKHQVPLTSPFLETARSFQQNKQQPVTPLVSFGHCSALQPSFAGLGFPRGEREHLCLALCAGTKSVEMFH